MKRQTKEEKKEKEKRIPESLGQLENRESRIERL
jgi:hypothetical protein